jgi:hypothetical protein
MPAFDVAIHDVVVEQGEVVDELDCDRRRNAISGAAAAGLGGKYRQRRSDRFAADAVSGGRLALGVEPPEVVGGDPAHVVTVESIDGGPKRWEDKRAGAAEDCGRLDAVVNTVEDASYTLGSAQLIHVVARHVV